MKVSIITVCYNSEKTIQKTIDSIRNQSYDNIEYIVIDGESTDSTLHIIQNNEDIINKWISESDEGLYDAMNKGIKLASGDVIGILNSDDTFYKENVLEEVVNFMLENDLEASTGNIIQHNEKGKVKRVYTSKNWKPEKLKIGFMPPHPSIFFKKELYEKYGYFKEGFKICADYEIIIRFFLSNKINWKYSGITTTAMLVGGASSSGVSSYKIITTEIKKALRANKITFSKFKINFRFVWKIKKI